MAHDLYDLLIVGGGINGVGIAREASGRGLKVLLVEKDDLASHTSSASSKLIHGGLRYLEQLDFRLVRESLAERERLLRTAPHLVRPLRFVVPQESSPRPAWLVRLGLFLYDRFAGRSALQGTESIRLESDPRGSALEAPVGPAFVYSDCSVDDSRLVILNAVDAAQRSAEIRTRSELISAERHDGIWLARLREAAGEQHVRARILVNAAGAWAGELFVRATGKEPRHDIRLVKGSHIVLPRLYDGEHAFLLQNPDRRVVFAIPFERDFTLVGTTDVDCPSPVDAPTVSADELAYLLDTVNRYFSLTVTAAEVAWSFSGVRTLRDPGGGDPSKVRRDYLLDLDARGGAPLLSIIGGKITTYRRLAERALDLLAPLLGGSDRRWTGNAPLPGGDLDGDTDELARELFDRFPFLSRPMLQRYARSYGSRAEQLLAGCSAVQDLGADFGAGLYEREVDYFIASEWARTADDILYRRTKLGLHIDSEGRRRLTAYVAAALEGRGMSDDAG